MADARVTVGDGIQGQMTQDGGQKNRDLTSRNHLGQGHSGDNVDGGKQRALALGLGQGADKGTDAGRIDLAGPFQRGADDKAGGFW